MNGSHWDVVNNIDQRTLIQKETQTITTKL